MSETGSNPASPASMVERVAKALHTAHYARGRGLGPSWGHIDRFEKEMWLFSARAAIEAMREPTIQMLLVNDIPVGGDCLSPKECWRAMIDEALK